MVILIAGASHTGKTLLSQKLLEKYGFPYLSIDHLKMGLIRSGQTDLTPEDDDKLKEYLWPIIKEIIKTVIENRQNLVIEGVYIPFDWKTYFNEDYLKEIKYCCLIFSEEYIEDNFEVIKRNANVIENRIDDSFCTKESVLQENKFNLEMCIKHNCDYLLIEKVYDSELNTFLIKFKEYNKGHSI